MKVTTPVQYPALLEIPMPVVTRRLSIRPLQVGDGALLEEAVSSNLAHLKKWMPWAHQPPRSVLECENDVRKRMTEYQLRTDLMLLGFHRETGEHILCTGFHRLNWNVGCLEIGYWIRQSQEGQGYVTEAVEGLVNFAFDHLGMNRIEIRCDAQNLRSMKVPERLGFEKEAVLKKQARAVDGSLRDTLVFARFKKI